MPRITVLHHGELAPQGATFEAAAGTSLCDALLANGIDIEHACGKGCCCASCHVIIRRGFSSLRPAGEDEEDQLGMAWGLEPESRLSCQVKLANEDLMVEIPRYSRNLARER